jgi:hypothetical protein
LYDGIGLVVCGDAEGWGYGVYEGREGTAGVADRDRGWGGGRKRLRNRGGKREGRGEDTGEWERGWGL